MIQMIIAFIAGVLVGMSAMGLLIIKKLGGDKIDDEDLFVPADDEDIPF